MNKDWVLFHLEEALGEIEDTIKEIKDDPEYAEPEYSVAMTHLYHHANTAWNSRNSSEQDTQESSENNFAGWRQFPTDVDISC